MPLSVLGVWDGHDSGAALLVDGQVVAAINEERLSRRKLEVRFPAAAIAACLELAALRPEEVDAVGACTSDVAKTIARLFPSTKESYYRVRRRLAAPGSAANLRKRAKYWITELGPNPLSRAVSRACLRRSLARAGLGRAELHIHDHHRCHAVAAAYASGFDPALVVTLDGVGDGLSATVSRFEHGRLEPLARTPAQHSAGIFFEHVTNLLNMRELEDEGKVMALAGFASPPSSNPLAGVLQAQGLRYRTSLPGHSLYGLLKRLHWRYPNEQFARMAQEALESATVALVRAAVREAGIPKVALAGGVASNVLVGRLIRLLPEVEDLFVFPHMGDGGLALGAALATARAGDGLSSIAFSGVALGPQFSEDEIRARLDAAQVRYTRPARLCADVAELLLRERVVLWFQGRMEYGPRALGQRSILARADRPALRDRLNLVLKRRVWYQPFCPSILESDARRLFADLKGTPDRYMTTAYRVRPAGREALAGVIGVDDTCRPQIVPDECPSEFASVLRAMHQRLGCGAVLNTSLNLHGEPLVCRPEEALALFTSSGADALALGPFLIEAAGSNP